MLHSPDNWKIEARREAIASSNFAWRFASYSRGKRVSPLFFLGDAVSVLREIPSESIDFCMTSPPYWGKREYENGGIGLEADYSEYITKLAEVFEEVKRTLKHTGSFWLNMGDTYLNKRLLGLPWRLALYLMDNQNWILRNSIIWNKIKGSPDNTLDRLRNVHENIFHFVKSSHGYYYDADAIRATPKKAKVVNGSIVSATGVTGVRYKRQIELSTELSPSEKEAAFLGLQSMLDRVKRREVADFRMIIRGQQRATHSPSGKVSGRARELQEKGFYFLKYHPKGAKPSDVWEIIPEDSQGRRLHFAAYPEDICRIPILATCPKDGIALDPFCGTGTTMLVSSILGRKSVGIDISTDYLVEAHDRCVSLL